MDLRKTLHDDHERLETLFDALLNRVHVNDAAAAQAAWTAFERGLVVHMEAEETSILPLFDGFDPAEAAAIRGDHARIRSLLGELGVLLELHALREEKTAELIDFLRAHAAREEGVLYRWAERELPEASKKSLLQRVLGTQHGHGRGVDDG